MHIFDGELLSVFAVGARLLAVEGALKCERVHDVELAEDHHAPRRLLLLLYAEGTP